MITDAKNELIQTGDKVRLLENNLICGIVSEAKTQIIEMINNNKKYKIHCKSVIKG